MANIWVCVERTQSRVCPQIASVGQHALSARKAMSSAVEHETATGSQATDSFSSVCKNLTERESQRIRARVRHRSVDHASVTPLKATKPTAHTPHPQIRTDTSEIFSSNGLLIRGA